MADLRKHSSTSNVFRFKLTKSADGTAFTGLTSSSSGLIISTICDNEATATAYTQASSNIETITTLGTFAAPTASKCRFKEVDATNHAGLYEFQFADARFSVASAKRLVISVSGVSGLFSADYEVQLTQADVYDATALGLSRLDAAVTSRMATYTQPTGFLAATFPGTVASTTNITAGTITTVTNLTNAPTSGDLTATMKASVTAAVPAAAAIRAEVDSNSTQLAAIVADTNELQTNQGNWLTADVSGLTSELAKVPKSDSTVTWNVTALASINAEVDTAIADAGLTAAGIADAVWDEAIAGHLTGGSTGEALNAAGAAGDPWTTTLPGAYSAGSAGYIIGNNIDAPISTVDTVVDGIQTDLSNATDGLGALKTLIDTMQGNVTDILADTNELQTNQGNWLTATGFSTHSAADVWSVATRVLTAGTNLNDLSTSDIDARLAAYDGPTNAEMVAAFTQIKGATWSSSTDTLEAIRDRGDAAWTGGGGLTAADIADAVWDEAIVGHLTGGSTGEALAAAGSAGDPWITDLPGSYSGADAGAILSAIKTKTDLITAGGFTVQRLSGRTINLFVFETYDYTLSTEDYTLKTINIAFEYNDTDVAAIADGDITKTSNSITFAIPAAVTSSAPRKLQYSIRDTANGNEVLVYGEVHVRSAAKDD